MLFGRERAKTQAFTAPKDRETKDAVKHNASTQLLGLPVEVRQRIWRYALGDRLIHIKYRTAGTYRWEGTDGCPPPLTQYAGGAGIFTYIVCRARVSEEEAQSLIQSDVYRPDPQGGLDQRVCRNRHQKCYALYDDCADKPMTGMYDDYIGGPIDLETVRRDHLPLQLLRVCRQIYIEANPILRGTNTWSFTNSRPFYKFLVARNAIQRRVLGKLHLDLEPRYAWRPEHGAHWWFCVLNRSLLKKFPAVHTIHIDITDNRWVRHSIYGWVRPLLWPDLEFNMLLDLRCLAPKVLTVACMETYKMDNMPMDHNECVRLAKDIHSKIFNQPMQVARPKYLTFSKTRHNS